VKLHHSSSGCLACLTAICTSGGHARHLEAVAHVDLDRYMGAWRVIACVENSVERDFVDAVETYERRSDGNIGVTFHWRDRSFRAPVRTHRFIGWVTDAETHARWKMRLVPFFTASYVIIGLGADYDWAAVAHPTRQFGWVLARARALPDDRYREILRLFVTQGYDQRAFIKVPQMVLSGHVAEVRG
jgi:apolipoprotein D and lipocalin family protein